jgi:hypothetical protein
VMTAEIGQDDNADDREGIQAEAEGVAKRHIYLRGVESLY